MFLHKSVKFTFQEDFRTRLLIIQVTIQLDIYFNLKCFIIAMNWLITTQWMSISQMTDICLYSRYLCVQSIYVCTVDICLYSQYLFAQSISVCTVGISVRPSLFTPFTKYTGLWPSLWVIWQVPRKEQEPLLSCPEQQS